MRNFEKFEPYWNTPSDIIVINDAARYMATITGNENNEKELKRWLKTLHADYEKQKITPLKHGNNRATYKKDLEQYIMDINDNMEEIKRNNDFILEKIRAYFLVYDDGNMKAEDFVEGIRKYLD